MVARGPGCGIPLQRWNSSAPQAEFPGTATTRETFLVVAVVVAVVVVVVAAVVQART